MNQDISNKKIVLKPESSDADIKNWALGVYPADESFQFWYMDIASGVWHRDLSHDPETDGKRLKLIADLVCDDKVTKNYKKGALLSALYYRICLSLRVVKESGKRDPATKTADAFLLSWCEQYCKEHRHPALIAFCKKANDVLSKIDDLNPKEIDVDRFEGEFLAEGKKWFPYDWKQGKNL